MRGGGRKKVCSSEGHLLICETVLALQTEEEEEERNTMASKKEKEGFNFNWESSSGLYYVSVKVLSCGTTTVGRRNFLLRSVFSSSDVTSQLIWKEEEEERKSEFRKSF